MPSDYIYVYTLLMHYTCVQNPRKYFHDICTTLPKSVQAAIAAFFQTTVNLPQLTRHHLRETIVNVDLENSTEDELLSESNSGNSTPSDIKTVDTTDSTRSSSLSKEWIKPLASNPIVTPPTPKTSLLEQRTRELRGLRVSSSLIYISFWLTISQISLIHSQAQLETERYEKIILEDQILENEQLINSLTRGTHTNNCCYYCNSILNVVYLLPHYREHGQEETAGLAEGHAEERKR